MAIRGFTLKNEERRRQVTIVALAAALFLSTLPVTNERALFSPFADTPLLGEFSPVAYAMFVGYGPGGGGPGGLVGRPGLPATGGGRAIQPPAAFAARVPPAGPATTPATDLPPVANFARPIDGPPAPANPGFPGTGAGPGEPLPIPDGPGPISIVPSNTEPTPTPAVPEPATWAMLMLGFAVVGGLLRRVRPAAARGIAAEISEG